MEQIKLTIEVVYTSGPFIEHEVVVPDMLSVDEIVEKVENHLQKGWDGSYLKLVPYNEDPNASQMQTDLYISIEGMRTFRISAQVIGERRPI